jgi:hypothetical protein
MTYDSSTEPAIRAARLALQAALITFTTVTLPPLAATVYQLTSAADPNLTMNQAPEQAVYDDIVRYVNYYLIPNGLFAGPPLPFR